MLGWNVINNWVYIEFVIYFGSIRKCIVVNGIDMMSGIVMFYEIYKEGSSNIDIVIY